MHDRLRLKSAASVQGVLPDHSANNGQKELNIPVKCFFGQADSTVVDKLHIKVEIGIL
ncbi:MAG: hypothetical protein RL242_274 [Pseudomonadota bacterium]|jgi:hypothetical protein